MINIDEHRTAEERKELVLSLTNGRGPSIVVEGSGVPAAFNEGIDMIQKGGRYLVMGQSSAGLATFMPSLITSKALDDRRQRFCRHPAFLQGPPVHTDQSLEVPLRETGQPQIPSGRGQRSARQHGVGQGDQTRHR